MSIIKMLRHSNWIAVNKCLVKAVGCNAAYFLGYLADKFEYFASRNELTKDCYFYVTASDAEEELGLSTREQATAIDRLVAGGLLFSMVKGVPAKRHFTFNDATDTALGAIIMRKTSFDKSAKLVSTKAQNLLQQKRETIYKEQIIISNNKEKGSGDFQSPLPQNEKSEFSSFLEQHGLTRLAATNFFLEKEKSCAKKEKVGEEGYLEALRRIDTYLKEKPKYLDGKKDFARVFDAFAEDKDTQACKGAFSAFFSAKYSEPYVRYSKADLTALEAILMHLRKTAGDAMPTGELMTKFFDALGKLPKFANPLSCKLAFIANDLPQIISAIKNPQSAAAGAQRPKTFKEIDAENAARAAQELAEKRISDYKAKFLQEDLERISSYVRSGSPIPEHLIQSEAYQVYISQQTQSAADDGW